jgi:hypothetical protein
MALKMIKMRPGFNKQETPSGTEGQWIDGDNVRFRYGQPEKIGGWLQLTRSAGLGGLPQQILGQVLEMTQWIRPISNDKFTALATDSGLYIFYEPTQGSNTLFDITPIKFTLSGDFTSTTGSSEVTITYTPGSFDPKNFDYILIKNASLPTGGETDLTFTDDGRRYRITSVNTTANTFKIELGYPKGTSAQTEGGTGMTNQGSADFAFLPTGAVVTGSAGPAALPSSSINYTAGVTQNTQWSLDVYQGKLIATNKDDYTYEWDTPASGSGAGTRATILANAPTASRLSLVSDRDGHLILFGTEQTIGTPSSQDNMFIRFSDQENFNDYQPTQINTAGSFRIDSGSTIVAAVQAKDYILVLTDSAAYIMQFIGPPYTFSIKQVGTDCGCMGQHAAIYANGAVYWMGSDKSFYVFDGTVKKVLCLVEDFVFNFDALAFYGNGPNLGISKVSGDFVYAGHNSGFSEISWFYPKASVSILKGGTVSEGTNIVDRIVTYNYLENIWYTGTLARTSWTDQGIFDKPRATEYINTDDLLSGVILVPNVIYFNDPTNVFITTAVMYGSTKLWQHEEGIDERYLYSYGPTDIPSYTNIVVSAYIQSGDFSLHDAGDAENFIKVRRFIPDFETLAGNAKITLNLRDYPSQTEASSSLGPFTINDTTTKIDTRARARLLNIKIENDAINETWKYGTFRIDIQPDGKR